MKIAAVIDSNNQLRPLDQGEIIVLIEGEGGKSTFSNPGFGFRHGGKERAMQLILNEGADAVVAKEGFLCPCSYEMSFGKVKYALTDANSLQELVDRLSDIELKSELEPAMYAEEDHHNHHHHAHKGSRSVNASLA
ncbi:MAG: hypothetical protein QXX17_06800 [Conexivisphaerales archaeon]